MNALKTAVLEHTTRQGVHHDWLIEDPALPDPAAADARLWTARVLPPPAQWAALGRITLEPIPPHRRAYLAYQGAVSGDRGRVRRVDAGRCAVQLWGAERRVIEVQMRALTARLVLTRVSPACWVAVLG